MVEYQGPVLAVWSDEKWNLDVKKFASLTDALESLLVTGQPHDWIIFGVQNEGRQEEEWIPKVLMRKKRTSK